MLPSIAEPPSPSPRPSVDTRPVNMSLSPSSLSGERWSPRTRRSAGPSSSAGRKEKCCGAFSWGYKWLGALTFRPLDRARSRSLRGRLPVVYSPRGGESLSLNDSGEEKRNVQSRYGRQQRHRSIEKIG